MADSALLAAARVEIQALRDHHQGKLSQTHVDELERLFEEGEAERDRLAEQILNGDGPQPRDPL